MSERVDSERLPTEISNFLSDLRRNGNDVDGANRVMAKHQRKLYAQGWRFLSLNDAGLWGAEWNLACTPPEGGISYCLQKFPEAIPPNNEWDCYIVIH